MKKWLVLTISMLLTSASFAYVETYSTYSSYPTYAGKASTCNSRNLRAEMRLHCKDHCNDYTTGSKYKKCLNRCLNHMYTDCRHTRYFIGIPEQPRYRSSI